MSAPGEPTPEEMANALVHVTPEGWVFLRARIEDPPVGDLSVDTHGDTPSVVDSRRERDRDHHAEDLRKVVAEIVRAERARRDVEVAELRAEVGRLRAELATRDAVAMSKLEADDEAHRYADARR